MITKLDLQRLYEWASNTNFPLNKKVLNKRKKKGTKDSN